MHSHALSSDSLVVSFSEAVNRNPITNNGSDQSLVLQLSPPIPGSGLWVQDPVGDVSLIHNGVPVSGRVVPIDRPYLLNARKLLHAGYLPEGTKPTREGRIGRFHLHQRRVP